MMAREYGETTIPITITGVELLTESCDACRACGATVVEYDGDEPIPGASDTCPNCGEPVPYDCVCNPYSTATASPWAETDITDFEEIF